jgi:hypothetical protein
LECATTSRQHHVKIADTFKANGHAILTNAERSMLFALRIVMNSLPKDLRDELVDELMIQQESLASAGAHHLFSIVLDDRCEPGLVKALGMAVSRYAEQSGTDDKSRTIAQAIVAKINANNASIAELRSEVFAISAAVRGKPTSLAASAREPVAYRRRTDAKPAEPSAKEPVVYRRRYGV